MGTSKPKIELEEVQLELPFDMPHIQLDPKNRVWYYDGYGLKRRIDNDKPYEE
jgi:hypothetical protein